MWKPTVYFLPIFLDMVWTEIYQADTLPKEAAKLPYNMWFVFT